MLKIDTKETGLLVLSRSDDKPRMVCCEDQHGTIIYTSALHGHSHGFAVNPDLFSLKTDTVELEGPHIPEGQLFQLQINPRE